MTLGSNKLTLGYWPFRGISQSIRYILHFTKTEFNDKMYSDRDEWFKGDKLTIDCPFPNLPYYVDGNVKLVQSMAILKMHNLNGSTAQDRACVYMLIDECHDQRMRLIRLSFNEKFDELKADFLASLVIWYEKMSNVMGSNKWITGSEICTADFILYDVLSWNYLFDPMSLNGKDRLMAFKTSFENLDGVREYIEQVPKNLLPPGGKFGNF